MKFIRTSEVRGQLSDVIDLAQREPVVLTRAGRPAAVIIGVDGLDEEQVVTGLDTEVWREIRLAREEPPVPEVEALRQLGLNSDRPQSRLNRRRRR